MEQTWLERSEFNDDRDDALIDELGKLAAILDPAPASVQDYASWAYTRRSSEKPGWFEVAVERDGS